MEPSRLRVKVQFKKIQGERKKEGGLVLRRLIPVLLACNIIVLICSGIGYAELTVEGPGIEPAPPVKTIVNPPGSVLGTATAEYRFTNQGSLPIDVFPFLECPPETIEAEIDTTPFTLAPNASADVEASFADLRGGTSIGDQVVCSLDGGTLEFFDIVVEIVGVRPLEATFTTTLGIEPQTVSREIAPLKFDFEENLKVQALLGGLVANLDVGVGLTGLEFSILSLGIPLGPFSIKNDIVFATPFNQSKRVIGPNQFVSNRMNISWKRPAFSLDALLLLEDANFPDPTTSELTSYPNPGNPDEEQAFGFGAIFTLDVNPGLLGGAKLSFIEAFCADPQNPRRIKKRTFMGRVECRSNDLGFTVEKVRLENVGFGEFGLSGLLDFRPEGTSFTLQTTIPGLDAQSGTFTLKTGDVTSLLFDMAALGMRTNLFNERLSIGGEMRLDAAAPAPLFKTDVRFPGNDRVTLTNSTQLMPVFGGVRVVENRAGLGVRLGGVEVRNEAIFCVPTSDHSGCRIPKFGTSADDHSPIVLQSNAMSMRAALQNVAGQLDGEMEITFDVSTDGINGIEAQFQLTF